MDENAVEDGDAQAGERHADPLLLLGHGRVLRPLNGLQQGAHLRSSTFELVLLGEEKLQVQGPPLLHATHIPSGERVDGRRAANPQVVSRSYGVRHPIWHRGQPFAPNLRILEELGDDPPILKLRVILLLRLLQSRPALLLHLLHQLGPHALREDVRHGHVCVAGRVDEALHALHDLLIPLVRMGHPVLERVVVDGRNVPGGHTQARQERSACRG
mmetsp:Transcript_18571/g.70236  ORF Transcript_18571/g.70236 Transcript_18571/m.70236 type:complete len:215 (+) Transcript_18571:1022-1666(+)